MKLKRLLTTLLLTSGLLLSGCEDTQTYVIPNATIDNIGFILRDFAGLNEMVITYSSEGPDRASYRVYIQTTAEYIPAEKETTYENRTYTSVNRQKNDGISDVNINRNNDGKIRTVKRPPEEILTKWYFTLQLNQDGNDVRLLAKSVGGFDPGKYVRDFVARLKYEGYTLNRPKKS